MRNEAHGFDQAQPAPQSAVEDGVHYVVSTLEVLENQVKLLTQRLQSVVRPVPPSPTPISTIKNVEVSPVYSQLAERMHQHAHRIENVSSELGALLNNLDV